MVPYRVGIEFETFGSVGNHLYPLECLFPGWGDSIKGLNGRICKRLKLVDFKEDTHLHSINQKREVGITPISTSEDYTISDGSLNEVRISISGYKQLIVLWNTLIQLKRCLIVPKVNGGIHIHIDAPFTSSDAAREYSVEWFSQIKVQSEILNIFNGYTGTYNVKGASDSKGKYVRVSPYYSIEFRIGRLTYDYATIIRYIIKCSDLVRRCKTDYLNHKLIDKSGLATTSRLGYILDYESDEDEDEEVNLEESTDPALSDRTDRITRSIRSLVDTTSNGVWYTARADNEYNLYM